MRINDAVVRAATTGTIWDSDLKGFGIRTGKQSKTFIVDIGRGRRKKLGRFNPPFFTASKAREEAAKILAEKQLGKIIPKHTAFEDAKKEFLEDCESRIRPSTLAQYKWHLGQLDFKRKSIGEITRRDIATVLKGLSPSNKEHCFRVSRTFFKWCVSQEFIDRSPMEKLDPPPNGKARERVLTDEELMKVYKHACKLQNGLSRLTWLLIRTGQRVGELRRLKTPYIAPDRITLPGEITKNGREHTFPISQETYATLQTFPKFNEYLFPASRTHVRGKPVEVMSATWSARQEFQKACKVSNWTLHDLRRTFATGLQKLGVRLEVTEALLNHVSGSRAGVVGIYQRHNWFEEMQAATSLWDKKLATLVAP